MRRASWTAIFLGAGAVLLVALVALRSLLNTPAVKRLKGGTE